MEICLCSCRGKRHPESLSWTLKKSYIRMQWPSVFDMSINLWKSQPGWWDSDPTSCCVMSGRASNLKWQAKKIARNAYSSLFSLINPCTTVQERNFPRKLSEMAKNEVLPRVKFSSFALYISKFVFYLRSIFWDVFSFWTWVATGDFHTCFC